jgi:hypothetical protein
MVMIPKRICTSSWARTWRRDGEVTLTPALSLSRERELLGSSVESIAATSVLGNCQVPVTWEVTGT